MLHVPLICAVLLTSCLGSGAAVVVCAQKAAAARCRWADPGFGRSPAEYIAVRSPADALQALIAVRVVHLQPIVCHAARPVLLLLSSTARCCPSPETR